MKIIYLLINLVYSPTGRSWLVLLLPMMQSITLKKYVGSGNIIKEFQTSPQILISFKFSILQKYYIASCHQSCLRLKYFRATSAHVKWLCTCNFLSSNHGRKTSSMSCGGHFLLMTIFKMAKDLKMAH